MSSTRYSCQTLIKLEFSRQIFATYPNIKFHENPSSGSRVVPYEHRAKRTDSNYLSFRSCDSCRRLPEPKHHSFLFSHWSASKRLVFMAARTPSVIVFLGRPLFLLSLGILFIINFGSLSSCILLTWPYHWSLFLSMMSIISGFFFTPIISFICSCTDSKLKVKNIQPKHNYLFLKAISYILRVKYIAIIRLIMKIMKNAWAWDLKPSNIILNNTHMQPLE